MSAQEDASNAEEAGNISSASNKFKKVFLKKRIDNSKETPSTSAKHGEASGYHKIVPYVSKLQKLRRKVRKTYPLMEIQENSMKTSRESQRYARAFPVDEIVNNNEESSVAADVAPDNLSEIFEVGGRNSPSHSVNSSDTEIISQANDTEEATSYSYEASNSSPNPSSLVAAPPAFEPYQQALVADCTVTETITSSEGTVINPEHESKKSYVYIDTCELFERPNLDGIGIQQNHLAPYLSSSKNDNNLDTKLVANLQGSSRPLTIPTLTSLKKNEERNNTRIKSSSFHYCDPYFPTLMQDAIRELALDGQFTDVTIEVDSHRMRCHKMILAASSKYFKAMFCNNYRERTQESVKIEAVSAAMMKILIRYAYTSYLEITCDNVQNVLEAASLLQFTRVMEACSNYFAGELAIENAPGIMELAQRHNLNHLLVLARLKCVTCFEELREKSDYLTLSVQLLESLICRNDLMVHQEEEVFKVVMEWCQHDEESRKQYLPQLLRHVKLPLIDEVYFVREIETHPLIKNNAHLFDLLMEARLFRVSSVLPARERLVPRHNANMHQVFITVGGCDKNDDFVNDVTMLDFQHKTRATLCHLPNSKKKARKDADESKKDSDSAEKTVKWAEFGCVTWKGNIVISGGKETKKEVWMFITALRQWVELGSLITGRWRHRMAICGGAVYAVGGYDGLLRIDSLEKYNEKENRWHEKRTMKEGVSSAAVCECNEKIYVIGGGPSVKVSSDKVQVYNPISDTWRLQTSMPDPAKCISAVSLGGMIYVAGGTLSYVLTFDTRAKIWTTIGDGLACERASCGMTLCNEMVFIVGGRDDEGKAISNVSYLDPKTKILRSECNLAYGISHHGCLTLQKYDNLKVKMV